MKLPPNYIFQCYRPHAWQFYCFFPALSISGNRAFSLLPVGGQKQYILPPLGNKIYFMQNCFIVSPLQHGCHENLLYSQSAEYKFKGGQLMRPSAWIQRHKAHSFGVRLALALNLKLTCQTQIISCKSPALCTNHIWTYSRSIQIRYCTCK